MKFSDEESRAPPDRGGLGTALTRAPCPA